MLFLGVATFVVPWGLFIVALLSGPVTGDHDTSFVVITLVYALVMTPAALCVLWPGAEQVAVGLQRIDGRSREGGLITTSTPCPFLAISNISCNAGDGVWWTTGSLGMIAEHRPPAGTAERPAHSAIRKLPR
jgi:hypothetical protein